MTRLTRTAYEALVAEDLAWLDAQPRSLERDHIRLIVMRSADHEYRGSIGLDPATGPDDTVITVNKSGRLAKQLTLTHPPAPSREPTPLERQAETMAAYERFRADAVKLGREAADELVKRNGKVTSTEVDALLRERGHGSLLDSIDARWLGAVFSPKKWHRTGLANTGSKGRAVSVWALRESAEGRGE